METFLAEMYNREMHMGSSGPGSRGGIKQHYRTRRKMLVIHGPRHALPQEFTLVIVTLWALWFARRQALHENIFLGPLSTYNFILKYIQELEECSPRKVSGGSPSVSARHPRWILPPEGIEKIRVDGAVSRVGNFGSFSAVCRNSSGAFMGASVIKINGVTDLATLEALVCREALALPTDLDLARILIASDIQGVVNDIKQCTEGVYASTTREIKDTP